MKNILIALIALCSPFLSMADSWDNLTKQQADEVMTYLNDNPFILDYCDCCSSDGEFQTNVYLVEVISAEIVTCDWDDTFYSVKVETKRVAQVPYSETGIDYKNVVKADGAGNEVISMNYTWVYNIEKQKATPFLNVVEYTTYGETNDNSGTCKSFTSFPNPKDTSVKAVLKNKKYKKWYKKTVQ